MCSRATLIHWLGQEGAKEEGESGEKGLEGGETRNGGKQGGESALGHTQRALLAVHVRCPDPGAHLLVLYGGTRGEPLEELLRQRVWSVRRGHTSRPFPKIYPLPTGVAPPTLRAPLRYALARNTTVPFAVHAPGAVSAGLRAISSHAPDQWIPLLATRADPDIYRAEAVFRAEGAAYLCIAYSNHGAGPTQAVRVAKFAIV